MTDLLDNIVVQVLIISTLGTFLIVLPILMVIQLILWVVSWLI